ncbi:PATHOGENESIS-RELATED 3, basic chitinase [Hibiscus trionum]|uniref:PATHOGENESIS-RELATED 3, basic chitinase n=1 Tax=Hibiscus trionum TaxID=183268 RepID=A0A9W7JDS0_HIBTR|nr:PATHOGENESIS-RELATED 3, basic chitinase [Hibiscus trionum]
MNATMSFESAFWYWMTPQSNSTVSCHDVMVGSWKPSIIDTLLGRLPGYGATTNLLNGASECGKGRNKAGAARIGYYLKYCYMLGVDYGENLDCFNQTPFSSYVAVENSM